LQDELPSDYSEVAVDEPAESDGDEAPESAFDVRGIASFEPKEADCIDAFALIEDCLGWSRFIGLGGKYAREIFVVFIAALCDLGCCALLEFGCGMRVRSCISNHLFLCWLVSFG
jgi:hypothetical protein